MGDQGQVILSLLDFNMKEKTMGNISKLAIALSDCCGAQHRMLQRYDSLLSDGTINIDAVPADVRTEMSDLTLDVLAKREAVEEVLNALPEEVIEKLSASV